MVPNAILNFKIRLKLNHKKLVERIINCVCIVHTLH